jgi:hypothetical protein
MPSIRKIAPPLARSRRLTARSTPPALNAAGMLHDGERWMHIDRAPKRWQAWLAKHDRMHVQVWHDATLHTVTARMKRVKGHPYWYIEKKIGGITYCRYLGKAEVMSWRRITDVAAELIVATSGLPGADVCQQVAGIHA